MAKKGVNKCILVGNLGKDPEARSMPNGNSVSNFSIATSETWKDKNTGQPQERSEWHKIAVFGKLAEICNEYLKKGSKVYIEGSLRTNKWQDKDGKDRYTTEIVATEMQMLDSRGSNDGLSSAGQNQQQQAGNIPKSSYDANHDNANNGLGPKVEHVSNDPNNFDMDIPF